MFIDDEKDSIVAEEQLANLDIKGIGFRRERAPSRQGVQRKDCVSKAA